MTTILITLLFILSPLAAQSESEETAPRHAINACPLGVAFGIFSVNYEYLVAPSHGILGRLDYEMIPETYSEGSIDAAGYAAVINYRKHLRDSLDSFYVGTYGRYRVYLGDGRLSGQEFSFALPEVTIGINVGRRWLWENGFNLNLTFGYGYAYSWREVENTSVEATKAIDAFEDEYAFMSPFLGEFSIGYAF
jgi:hypothetical protein